MIKLALSMKKVRSSIGDSKLGLAVLILVSFPQTHTTKTGTKDVMISDREAKNVHVYDVMLAHLQEISSTSKEGERFGGFLGVIKLTFVCHH